MSTYLTNIYLWSSSTHVLSFDIHVPSVVWTTPLYAPSTHTPGDRLLKEIVSYISAYQFGICHTSKVILPHVLENTSLVLVSPPHYIMPYVEIEILNVTIYVSLVACMSVGRVLTHTDICACLIRVRGMTWAWPNPLRLPYPCCHTLLYTPQTITPCPYWSKLWFYKPAD